MVPSAYCDKLQRFHDASAATIPHSPALTERQRNYTHSFFRVAAEHGLTF
eukprot:m.924773 g.924773  ORF g.924773 m.924773 type:complete len:50 (-) comp23771_c0_seq7:231-380(-)